MKLNYHRQFKKQYKKLTSQKKKKVKSAIMLFQKNPFDDQLKNHALKGKLKGRRAISASGDLRLVFREYEQYTLVLFLELGSHNQVY